MPLWNDITDLIALLAKAYLLYLLIGSTAVAACFLLVRRRPPAPASPEQSGTAVRDPE